MNKDVYQTTLKSLKWKNNLKEDILRSFAKGSISANDFPHVCEKHFEEQLQAIKDDLWELFPNMKDKDPFPYNKKTKKYDSLIKIEDEK